MKKLHLTIFCTVTVFCLGISQTLSVSNLKNATLTSKALTNQAEVEQSLYDLNHEVFQIEVLNRIFITHLKNDGVIASNCSQINVQLTQNSLTVNNEVMSDVLKEKYLSLYLGFTRKKLDINKPIAYEINDSFNVFIAGKD